MTGKELIIEVFKGNPTPRAPWVPFAGVHAGKLIGVKASIIGKVPGSFAGGTTENYYYLMKPIETGLPFDKETEEIRWATDDEAKELISQTTNITGRRRDLMVLDAAVSAYGKLLTPSSA